VQAGWVLRVRRSLVWGPWGPWTDVSLTPGKQNQALRLATSPGCFLPRCCAGTEGAGAGSSRQGECEQGGQGEGQAGRRQAGWAAPCPGRGAAKGQAWGETGQRGGRSLVGHCRQKQAGGQALKGPSPFTQAPPERRGVLARCWHGFAEETGGKASPAWGCWGGLGRCLASEWGSARWAGGQGSWSWGLALGGTLRGQGQALHPPEREAGQFAQPRLISQRDGSSHPLPAASPSQGERPPGWERGPCRSAAVAGGSLPFGGWQGPPPEPPHRHSMARVCSAPWYCSPLPQAGNMCDELAGPQAGAWVAGAGGRTGEGSRPALCLLPLRQLAGARRVSRHRSRHGTPLPRCGAVVRPQTRR